MSSYLTPSEIKLLGIDGARGLQILKTDSLSKKLKNIKAIKQINMGSRKQTKNRSGGKTGRR